MLFRTLSSFLKSYCLGSFITDWQLAQTEAEINTYRFGCTQLGGTNCERNGRKARHLSADCLWRMALKWVETEAKGRSWKSSFNKSRLDRYVCSSLRNESRILIESEWIGFSWNLHFNNKDVSSRILVYSLVENIKYLCSSCIGDQQQKYYYVTNLISRNLLCRLFICIQEVVYFCLSHQRQCFMTWNYARSNLH